MKTFKAFLLIALFAVATFGQVTTTTISNWSAGDVGGKYVVSCSFTMDSLNSHATLSKAFSLNGFDNGDLLTVPATFKLNTTLNSYAGADSNKYVSIVLLGCYNGLADTVAIDTVIRLVTTAGQADTNGVLTFNSKRAVNYRLCIKPYKTGGHDVNGTLSIVFVKP